MVVVFDSKITDNFCELQHIHKIISLLSKELDDSYELLIVNDQCVQLPATTISSKKIVIMLSDERGIIPHWIDSADIVFRTLSSNSSCDYNKIYPIPTGWFGPIDGSVKYIGEQPKKPLAEREFDAFYSGKATKGERMFFFKRAVRATRKVNAVMNGTTGWLQGETYM